MKNRKHGAVPRRIQKTDALPRALERRRLGLAVSDHRGHDQVRGVEGGAEGMHEHVAELASLVDGPWRRHAHVARNAAGRRELTEQPLHPAHITRDVGVDLRIRSFEVDLRDDGRAAMTWSREIDDIGVVPHDEPVEVRVHERLAG